MNALERQQRAQQFRQSQKIYDTIDFTRHKDAPVRTRRFEQPNNQESDIRHGIYQPTDHIDFDQTVSYKDHLSQQQPRIENTNTRFLNPHEHPDAVPTFTKKLDTEVDAIMKNPIPEPSHQHPLIHRMQTFYADVGQSVQRDMNVPPEFLCGTSTQKLLGDDVAGYLNGVYIDRGYQIRKLQIPRDQMKETSKFYSMEPTSKATQESAGVKTQKLESVQQTLNGIYKREDPVEYDGGMKIYTSKINQIDATHGLKTDYKDLKPGYFGGQRDGGDMELYRRK